MFVQIFQQVFEVLVAKTHKFDGHGLAVANLLKSIMQEWGGAKTIRIFGIHLTIIDEDWHCQKIYFIAHSLIMGSQEKYKSKS